MDQDMMKKVGLFALATFGVVYFFKARRTGERCRRATHDYLQTQGYDDVDALSKATDYCGSSGGEVLAREAP
jgi:hypothetical protein